MLNLLRKRRLAKIMSHPQNPHYFGLLLIDWSCLHNVHIHAHIKNLNIQSNRKGLMVLNIPLRLRAK
ncbi:hypothetical protein HanXRQr2_Chr14g0653181 [Helianthus annuus]|uniref:Uncharacterized protein n=1 Tax=Helianthus annuus TaxID=4232 RepID=A0A9K3H982_HELAN|nr:hypothetical protein HanXRQr2_Chr14g0653181 [Helianthus annuus]